MYLLDTATGQFHLIDDPQTTRYAILSHTWDSTGEQSFQEIVKLQAVAQGRANAARVAARPEHEVTACSSILGDPALSPKIKGTCDIARSNGYALVWIDSCCINKDSSSELSEAINSMFDWYRLAVICYAYLSDVSDDVRRLLFDSLASAEFRASKWHTRGWTLQELIAPKHVLFVTRDWRTFGTKVSLAPALSRITGINSEVLTHDVSLDSFSVAQRMCWAAGRRTTRPEDEAYSLMGLFGVHMPTIYGEGRGAFLRLQEEIMKRIPDQTLFAWGPRYVEGARYEEDRSPYGGEGPWGLFARSPESFLNCPHLIPLSETMSTTLLPKAVSAVDHLDPTVGATGIRFHALMLPAEHVPSAFKLNVALLRCWDSKHERLLVLPLSSPAGQAPSSTGLVVGVNDTPWSHYKKRVFAYTPESLRIALAHAYMDTVSVLPVYDQPSIRPSLNTSMLFVQAVVLSSWCIPLLDMQGFSIQGPSSLQIPAFAKHKPAHSSFTFLYRGSTARSRLVVTVAPDKRQAKPPPLRDYGDWGTFELREDGVPVDGTGLILLVTFTVARPVGGDELGLVRYRPSGLAVVVGKLSVQVITTASSAMLDA
ncbi:hypothetical protein BN946_scf185027.g6 [Trametes cinnabarina]|uniref:Uncharacterized protein n=1 Tax=Pycnoporus cinnabarinus TaxID=5643 RepID=A0A060SUJ4_PYCCI|nr:hypothetical protein BN946_scf185027.g6 [Trametes cinnabarina]